MFVSPHNTHMVDSRFFGSPTKIFEYMAMAGGIVASDLEQIGQVLSPALRASTWAAGQPAVTNQRAVLCKPGDLEEFVEAVVRLVAVARRVPRWAAMPARRYWIITRGSSTSPGSGSFCRSATTPAHRAPDDKTHLDRIATGDGYKDEVQNQWNNNPCGSHYVKKASAHTLDWFLEAERYRYGEYAPWMPAVMEFSQHAGEEVLEIGGGMGTDLAQFARHGARTTDLDLSAGHLTFAHENFGLRGLKGNFVHHDAERLPFDDGRFDLVYSNGVIHHTPNTVQVIGEIHRVLKPGGQAIVMVYAENSLHYWGRLVYALGLAKGMLEHCSMGEIMSRHVELTTTGARPLVKVYTKARLRDMFAAFADVRVCKRQLIRVELPPGLRWLPVRPLGRLMGWNLIVKATKGTENQRRGR